MAKFTADQVTAEIESQAPQFGLSPKIVKAILFAENSGPSGKLPDTFDGATTSPRGARGVLQVMPATESALVGLGYLPRTHKYDPDNLGSQVAASLAALKEMKSRQKNPADIMELATMYNGGTGAWKSYHSGGALPDETQKYQVKVKQALGLEPGMSDPAAPVTEARQQQRSSSSTSGKQFVPDFLDGYTKLTQMLIGSGGTADQALGVMQQAGAQRAVAQATAEEGIKKYAIDAGAQSIAEAMQAGTQAARARATIQQANIDHEQVDNIYTQTVQKFNDLAVQAEPLGAEIDKRMSVGFFDNPLEYLVNQVRLPGMVGQYNANVRERNRAAETLTSLQAMAGTQQSISQSMDAEQILATGRAKAATAASKAQFELAQVQMGGADAAARTAAAELGIAQTKVDAAGRLASLTAQQVSERNATSDVSDRKMAEQVSVDKINNWYRLIGRNEQLTPAQYKSLSAADRSFLEKSAGTGIVAAKFSDAADAIEEWGNAESISKTTPAMIGWFKNTIAAASAKAKETFAQAEGMAKLSGKPLKDDEHFKYELNQMQAAYQAQAADMSNASDNNPLKVQYAVVSKDARLAGNTVAMYVNKYGPGGTEAVLPKIEERYLLDRMVAGVNAGTLTPQVAAEQLKQFYEIGKEVQRRDTKYPLFGISENKGYIVKIPSPSFWGGGVRIPEEKALDLTNTAQVSAYLTKAAAIKNAEALAGQITAGSF